MILVVFIVNQIIQRLLLDGDQPFVDRRFQRRRVFPHYPGDALGQAHRQVNINVGIVSLVDQSNILVGDGIFDLPGGYHADQFLGRDVSRHLHDVDIAADLIGEIEQAGIVCRMFTHMDALAHQVDRAGDQLLLDLMPLHIAPIAGQALHQHLPDAVERRGKADLAGPVLGNGQVMGHQVSLAPVEQVEDIVEIAHHYNLQIHLQMAGERLQQLILEAHRLPLVDKIAVGPVAAQGHQLAAAADLIQIDIHFRLDDFIIDRRNPLGPFRNIVITGTAAHQKGKQQYTNCITHSGHNALLQYAGRINASTRFAPLSGIGIRVCQGKFHGTSIRFWSRRQDNAETGKIKRSLIKRYGGTANCAVPPYRFFQINVRCMIQTQIVWHDPQFGSCHTISIGSYHTISRGSFF